MNPLILRRLIGGGALAVLRAFPSGYPSGKVKPVLTRFSGDAVSPEFYVSGASRYFTTNISLSPIIDPSGTTLKFYVDPDTGLDTNPGTSALPFKSIKKAFTAGNLPVPDEKTIYVKPGLYDKTTGWNNEYDGTYALKTQMLPWGEGVVTVSQHHPGLVWSLVSGAMYSCTIGTGGIGTVCDAANLNSDGDYGRLAWVASSAAVESTASSWYLNGTTLYVRTFDGRAPDSSIFAYAAVDEPNFKLQDSVLYIENFRFYGGNRGFSANCGTGTHALTVLMKNCEFKYARYEGFKITAAGTVCFQDCVAAMNEQDGFSYGNFNDPAKTPFVLEIGCIGRWNGWTGASSNQGSTAHNGSTVIRVNGQYYENEADNVADVSGAMIWMLGCVAHDSRSATWSDFAIGNGVGGETATMWLDRCSSFGSPTALRSTPATATAYTFEFEQDVANYAGTTVIPYAP